MRRRPISLKTSWPCTTASALLLRFRSSCGATSSPPTPQTWADHMTVTREFVHCGATPGCDTHGEGENMQAETYFMPNAPSTTKLQAGWVNEKNYYQKWATNSLPKTANWTGWFPGHYNQMVWNTTKEVGCATGFTPVLPHTAFGDNLHGVYLICRYSPAGNIDGQKPY